jgi:hypothetical protein
MGALASGPFKRNSFGIEAQNCQRSADPGKLKTRIQIVPTIVLLGSVSTGKMS